MVFFCTAAALGTYAALAFICAFCILYPAQAAVAANPAAAMRGPTYSVTRGKTPVLSADQARTLLDSIDATTLVGLRDRALIAVMVYSFARVSSG